MLNAISPEDHALVELASALRERSYHFTTPTPATHERVNARPENAWAQDLQGIFGWSRPFREETAPPQVLDLMRRAQVLEERDGELRSMLRLSTLSGQVFWHSAFPTTQADAVFFGPDTYRFALAIEHHLALHPRPITRAVDICCGAGPGAIVTALTRPQAQVLGVDINHEALRLARINARLAGAEIFEPLYSNLLHDVEGNFDFITANPPYLVDPSERAYRHGGGPLGAGLSIAIVEAALRRLNPNGTLLLYTGAAIVEGRDPFRAEIEKMLPSGVTWSYQEVDVDVFGEELEGGAYATCDRIAAVVLTITKH
jgi:methylase of polypeptide subunit release factors